MEPDSLTSEIQAAIPHNMVSQEPSLPQAASEPRATPDVSSLQFDVSHVDLACLTPADTPEAVRPDKPGAESDAEAINMADSSGNLVSLPLQDVVLAEDTSLASVEDAFEAGEPTLPTIDLRDVTTASAQTDAARPSAPEETVEATGMDDKRVEDSVLSVEANKLSANARADVVELQSSLDFDPATLSEAEATLLDLAIPTLDEAPFTSADAFLPYPPSDIEELPTTAETPPESLLTSSDMFALENLEDPMPPEHLTLELEPPVLPKDLASNLLTETEAAPTLLPDPPDIPETLTDAGPEPDLPVVEALTFEDVDDIALPTHLTLELDGSEMASEVSSIVLDNLQLDNPPNATQSPLSPRDDQADEEEELFLDLDDLELDDDERA
jgi:hypothetical protein